MCDMGNEIIRSVTLKFIAVVVVVVIVLIGSGVYEFSYY